MVVGGGGGGWLAAHTYLNHTIIHALPHIYNIHPETYLGCRLLQSLFLPGTGKRQGRRKKERKKGTL